MEKPTEPEVRSRRRLVTVLTVVVALGGLLLVGLPLAIEWGAEYALTRLTDGRVEIADVDFNPFTGRLAVTTLQGDARYPTLEFGLADVKLDWWPLFRKEISLVAITLRDTRVAVKRKGDGETQVSGYFLPPAADTAAPQEPTGEPWLFSLNRLLLENVEIDFVQDDLHLDLLVRRAELTGLSSTLPNQAARLSADLRLNGGDIVLDLAMKPFAREISGEGEVRIATLPLGWVRPVVRNVLEEIDGKLSANLKVGFSLPADSAGPQVKAGGEVTVADLDIFPADRPYRLREKKIAWAGEVRLEDERLAVDGSLQLDGTTIEDLERELALLNLQQLRVAGLALAGEDVRAGEIQLAGFRLLPAEQADADLVSWQGLQLKQLHWDGMGLDLPEVELDGLNARLVLEPNGEIGGINRLLPPESTAEESAPEKKEQGEAFRWRLGAFVLRQGDLAFVDRSLSEPFRLDLNKLQLSVGELSSTAPAGKTPIKLQGSFDRYATIDVAGDISPLLQKPVISLDATLRNFNLPPVSPYTSKAMQMRIAQGQLDSDIGVSLDKNHLEAEIGLLLRRFETNESRAFEAGKEKPPGSLVNLPLNLLKDRNDEIHLTLPVSGDLDNPDFGVASVVQQALAAAVQKAVMASLAPLGVKLLTGTVLPPGSTWLASSLLDMLTHIEFPPVTFSAGSDALQPDVAGQLGKTVALLVERPQLRLRLCGLATADDLRERQRVERTAWENEQRAVLKKGEKLPEPPSFLIDQAVGIEHYQPALLELAGNRGERIKQHLVSEQQIEANRLFLCDPDIDLVDEGPPRVEVAL